MQKPIFTPANVPFDFFARPNAKTALIGDSLTEMMVQFGDVVRLHPFLKLYLVNDLEALQDILLNKVEHFLKTDNLYRHMCRIFGNGLVTNPHSWAPRRSHYQSHFHPRILQQAAPFILHHTHARLDQWALSHQPINVAAELLELVYNTSAHILFGEDLSQQAKTTIKNIHDSNQLFMKNVFLPRWLPHPNTIKYYWKRRQLRRYLAAIVDARCQAPQEEPQNLLDSFIALQQANTPYKLTAKEVIDEFIVFLITGHETTGGLLGWVWHVLGKYPEHLVTLYEEIDRVLGQQPMSYEHMAQLPFLRMVLDETLRLYPPIWIFSRQNHDCGHVGAYRIPNRSTLIICPYTIHHHPAYWPDPYHFDPYRFTKDNKQERPKFSYIPFGKGPRVCIAGNLAIFQASMILVTLLQRFKVTPLPNEDVKPQFIVTLKPSAPVLIKVEPRF